VQYQLTQTAPTAVQSGSFLLRDFFSSECKTIESVAYTVYLYSFINTAATQVGTATTATQARVV